MFKGENERTKGRQWVVGVCRTYLHVRLTVVTFSMLLASTSRENRVPLEMVKPGSNSKHSLRDESNHNIWPLNVSNTRNKRNNMQFLVDNITRFTIDLLNMLKIMCFSLQICLA